MTRFEDYCDKYAHIRMKREDGILELTFHTDGGTLVWGGPHGEFGPAFRDMVGSPEPDRHPHWHGRLLY